MPDPLRIREFEDSGILPSGSAPPVPIPPGHVGPVVLPGTGRMIWWTGRVAIGLRHQPTRSETISQSAQWVQDLMLQKSRRRASPWRRWSAALGA